MTYGEKIVFQSWSELQKLENDRRLANIAKLIDYYNGDQIEYMKKYLKLQNLDDFPYYFTNITKRIIRKISEVYKLQPTRILGNAENDTYNNLTYRKDARMKIAERMANLLGMVGVRPRVVDGYFEYDILRQFTAYFDNDPLKPYAIKYLIAQTDNKRFYEYWDSENHFVLDENNTKVDVTRFGFEDDLNPYGVIPWVFCHKTEIIDDFYNTGEAADDLVNANEHINLTLSELSHKYRYVAFNPPYALTHANVDDTVFGYNKMLVISDTDAQVGTLNTQYDFLKDIEFIKFQFQAIERQFGLNINWGMEGAPSGFSLVVQNIDHLNDLRNMTEICRQWEIAIYDMEQLIGKVDGVNVPGGELRVDFSEVEQPISQEEKNAKWEFEFRNGLSSREDYWREQNPDITDEEIQVRLDRITNENRTFNQAQQTEPTVGELFRNV